MINAIDEKIIMHKCFRRECRICKRIYKECRCLFLNKKEKLLGVCEECIKKAMKIEENDINKVKNI